MTDGNFQRPGRSGSSVNPYPASETASSCGLNNSTQSQNCPGNAAKAEPVSVITSLMNGAGPIGGSAHERTRTNRVPVSIPGTTARNNPSATPSTCPPSTAVQTGGGPPTGGARAATALTPPRDARRGSLKPCPT